ncbi:MAG TPA: hypothetical protein VN428_07455 [Bryobacteraceae bacterium]|nr:hypothetical protein [Bryobacteraceae bacterium]
MQLQGCAGVLGVSILAGFATAQQPERPEDVIAAAKEFARSLGLPETGNFRRSSDKSVASYRCYFTGKLELPSSYDKLELRQGSASGCPVDEREHDVFFYPIEAVASGKAEVTTALADATPERVLMVVPHEDMHGSSGIEKLGTELEESITTLIGFRTAAEFARSRYGDGSAVYRNLSAEAGLFLAKARIVNRYHSELTALYDDVRAGRVNREDALAGKARAFERLSKECGAIRPLPTSFNACPAVGNNAALAFDFTYTKHYALIYDLHMAQGGDVRKTLEALEEVGRSAQGGEAAAVHRIEELTRESKPAATSGRQ